MKIVSINWYENIPKKWEERPLWTILTPRKNKNSDGAEKNLLSLSYGKIIRKNIDICTGLVPESFNGYNIVEAGDIVMRLTDLQNDQRSLRTGLVIEHGIITSAYLSLVLNRNNDSRYFHYLLHSFDIIKGLYNMGEGIRQNLNYEELSRLYLPVPPLFEQSRIASFLDDRCTKIDASIQKCKEINDKLDEYRKAIITKAVTKGVRGEREMKASGMNWIDFIPKEWQFLKMNWICETITDYVASGSFADLAENVEYLDYPDYAMLVRTTDLSNKGRTSQPVYVNRHSYEFLANSNIFGGEIVLPNVGSVGEAYIVPRMYERMTLGPNCIVIKANVNNEDKYLYYYFNSIIGSKNLIDLAQITTQAKFNKTNFRAMRILCPNKNEQNKIISYLDKRCAEIDSAKAKNDAIIKKLEEYKKSLIYNAVTGKIEC